MRTGRPLAGGGCSAGPAAAAGAAQVSGTGTGRVPRGSPRLSPHVSPSPAPGGLHPTPRPSSAVPRRRTALVPPWRPPPPLCNAPPALRFLSVVPGAGSAWRAVPWFPPPRSSAEGSDPRGTPARARSRSREDRGAGPARFSPTGIAAVGARELDRAPVWGELRWNRCKWLPGRDCA